MIIFAKSMVNGYIRKDGVQVATHYRKADKFADKAHQGQYRDCIEGAVKVPYIMHPRAVVSILFDEAGITDKETLQAAVLHDTIEDTGVTHAQLMHIFGKTVADTVQELTNPFGMTKEGKKDAQVAMVNKFSQRAANIKLADKTANLRDILNSPPNWSNEKKKKYYQDAMAVVLAIPNKDHTLENLFMHAYLTGMRQF